MSAYESGLFDNPDANANIPPRADRPDWTGFPDGGVGPEPKGPSTEDKIDQIYEWLDEIMPAARVAMKLMTARSNLMSRWRGGKNAE